MCEWHRQWSRPSVVAEETHGLLLKGAVCLSERRLDKFVLVCEHLLKLLFEQSLPMRPGRICSCLHTAWAVIPEVPLNFLLSESSAAFKAANSPRLTWKETRNYEPRFAINRANFLRYIYIYTHFFFSIIVRHSGAGTLLLFYLCYGAQGRSSFGCQTSRLSVFAKDVSGGKFDFFVPFHVLTPFFFPQKMLRTTCNSAQNATEEKESYKTKTSFVFR